MKYLIDINYKNKERYYKIIKIPLESKIEVSKYENIYIIKLNGNVDSHLYELKEDEIYGFSIQRIL